MRRFAAVAAIALFAAPSAAARMPLAPCDHGGTRGLCGRLVVPENRALAHGRTISLHVMVLPATVAKPKPAPDPVFYLAGGPGGAATEMAGWFVNNFIELNERHDIVLVDQRGTGGSHPLACPQPREGEAPRAFAKRCIATLDGDARRYGTADAMDDLDAVRRALGYGRIDVFGGSYGATAAQVFLNRHPEAVRSAVLDGGTLLTVPIYERLGSNGRRTLDLLARSCAADDHCARAYHGWRSGLGELLARLGRKARRVQVPGVGRVTLTPASAAGTIQSLTLNPTEAGQVPYVVSHALRGDFQPLARAAVRPSTSAPPPTAVMPTSATCTEPWAVRDPVRVAADARGTFLAAAARGWAAHQRLVCSVFPKRTERAADWRAPRSSAPLLAISGQADPQDPPANIRAIRRTMPNSRVVVVPGGLHGNSQFGCLPSLVARFVDRGSAAGLDTGCIRPVTPIWVY